MKDVVYSMAAAKPLFWRGWGGLHLGSTGAVTDINANVSQTVSYAPFGEVVSEYIRGNWNDYTTDYLFNAKELDEESGMYYYSARYYSPPIFTARDPMEDKKPWITPYAYCRNNPLRFIDPTGMTVDIAGEGKDAFFAEVEKGAKALGISVKMNDKGRLSAEYVGEGAVSKGGQQFLDAVNSESVHVKIDARAQNDNIADGNPFFGGAFMGNKVDGQTIGKDDFIPKSVTAFQTVNASDLEQMDNFFGAPGMSSIHEITEAFEGGKISLRDGVSSPRNGLSGNIYNRAHDAATMQSGRPHEVTIVDPILRSLKVGIRIEGRKSGVTKEFKTIMTR